MGKLSVTLQTDTIGINAVDSKQTAVLNVKDIVLGVAAVKAESLISLDTNNAIKIGTDNQLLVDNTHLEQAIANKADVVDLTTTNDNVTALQTALTSKTDKSYVDDLDTATNNRIDSTNEALSSLNGTQVAQASTIATKANQSDLDATNKTVSDNYTALNDVINTKANASDLTTTNQNVAANTSNISANTSAIAAKANQSDLTELSSQVSKNTNDIANKINKTDVIAVAQGGTGANNVATARSNLGLGTASIKDAGTSADNVLLLNNDGYIPQSALNGVYKNTTLDISNANIYRFSTNNGWESSATVYGLGEIRLGGNITGVIVIKTTVPSSTGTVVSINIDGITDSETSTIKINILGYTSGNVSKFSYGSKDIPVRKGTTPDGYLCFILGDINTVIGTSTAISIISAHVNFRINTNYLTNWSLYYTNDLTKYTNISAFATQKQSFIEASVYTKLADSSFDGSVKSLKSGSASYKKGWRKLTSTLPSAVGEVTVAHGVTTVETVQAKVTNSDGVIIYNNDIDPANQFYVRVNGANLVLGVTANSTKVFGKAVTIYVGEEL